MKREDLTGMDMFLARQNPETFFIPPLDLWAYWHESF